MAPLIWESRPDGLRSPALVCAFTGWNDAGDAASAALRFVGASLDAKRFAHVDPEEFYDFQATRPRIRVTEGHVREVEWPTVEIYAARAPAADRDLVLLVGPEPGAHWQTFSRVVVELAEALGVELVVTLGALLADIPHTLPVSITAIASDDDLVAGMGLNAANYEGPTGITGVVHHALVNAGLSCASLWATVPHYVAAAPNPKAALALTRRLETLVGVSVDAQELEVAAADYERQVSRAVEADPDVQAFVERLERAAEQEPEEDEDDDSFDPTRLPSGDALARDFQRFLRQQGGGAGGPP